MALTKQEVDEELTFQHTLHDTYQRRLRILEIQRATKGETEATPSMIIEIETIQDQLRKVDEAIQKLEEQALASQPSLVEIEYRMLAAKLWAMPLGRPTVAGMAELELARLKSGLAIAKTQQIEYEVRTALAQEAFSGIDASFGGFLPRMIEIREDITTTDEENMTKFRRTIRNQGDFTWRPNINIGRQDIYSSGLQLIGCAIRLSKQRALELFLAILPADMQIDIGKFSSDLFPANRVWNYVEDRELFEWFIQNLDRSIKERHTSSE